MTATGLFCRFPFYQIRDGNGVGDTAYYRTTAVTPTITINLPFTTYLEYISVYPECQE